MVQKHRLSARWIQKQFQELGNTCTIVEVARAFATDEYRDVAETLTNHTAYCHVWILTEQDISVDEGEARAGDLVFDFDYSYEPYLKQMNRIIYDGRTFQISDVRRFDAVGNISLMISCFTKKYSDGTANTKTLIEDVEVSPNYSKIWEANKTLSDDLKSSDDFSY